ncbi:hypothetical protein SLH49_09650 [Cognatiyoonia sp. IB215446]|uniref:hypothetical protein n=1 Tax=Cognatiyoonia sp. IB215446 TaxID=3097355 RepID=UPI002A1202C7|nr:hypothetical protein [Cognatiyoonia sp. IB215446]MDX8348251.1 hypothetical protein [Cognatiyoonia sp. IB215446]
MIRTTAMIAVVVGLAACGEGSGDNDTLAGGGGNAAALTFDELNETNSQIINEVASSSVTPEDDIPDSGSSIYRGALTLTLQDGSGEGVIGQAQVNANFATSVVTGGADNFFDLDGNATSGTVTIANGLILPGVSQVTGDINGTVTFDGTPLALDTTLTGTISGNDADYISGVVTGTGADSGTATTVDVQGSLFTER